MKKVILAAGGTGGHFFAAYAVGEELIKRGYNVHIFTDIRCQRYIPLNSLINFSVLNLKNSPKSLLQLINFLYYLQTSFLKSLLLLFTIKPDIMVGFGGYPTIPTILVGMFLKIPLVIYEQNSCMGKVNKFFTKFAKKIVLSYEKTNYLPHNIEHKIAITGGIVRKNIRNLEIKTITKKYFKILVFGGSQGAKIFAEIIPSAIEFLINKNPKLKLHISQQAAKKDQIKIDKIYSALNISYQLSEFFDDIAHEYQDTNLIISRAGASTIEELTYIGLPAIFIPLPTSTDNHQYHNAQLLAKHKASWCLEQKNVTPANLANKILFLINNPNILKQAACNLVKMKKEGHKLLSDLIEKMVI